MGGIVGVETDYIHVPSVPFGYLENFATNVEIQSQVRIMIHFHDPSSWSIIMIHLHDLVLDEFPREINVCILVGVDCG